jgi:hypothetical protein
MIQEEFSDLIKEYGLRHDKTNKVLVENAHYVGFVMARLTYI